MKHFLIVTETNIFNIQLSILALTQMDQYRLQAKKGDGTFSQVFMAESLKTGRHVAIKCMKKKFQNLQKVKKLKEIQALKLLSPHQNIIKLIQVLYDQPTGKLALVFQLMEQNLYECLVKRKNLSLQKIKYYMYLLLRSIAFIHKKGIFHRDIKPENVLISGDVIKLADFGSCKGIYSKHPYTEYISTRWYRAPQCLMTDGYYDAKMDIWGYGCVLFQMVSKYPLFNGSSEIDQIHKINNILGPPCPQLLARFKSKATHMKPNQWNFTQKKGIGIQKMLPNAPKQLINLLSKLLQYDPLKRITAQEALQHEYFIDIANISNNNKFRSTIFGLPGSYSQNKSQKNQDTPEKSKARSKKKKQALLKKQNSKAMIQEQTNSLPPIHQLRLDVKFNLFGSTVKTHDNIFKKTGMQVNKKKEQYMITGKKY